MTTLLLLGSFLVGGLLLQSLLLWAIARLFAAPAASLLRAFVAVLLLATASIALLLASGAVLQQATPVGNAMLVVVELGQFVAMLLLTWAVITLVFRVSAGKGALIGLCNCLAGGVLGVGAYFGLLQFVQTFVVPSNNMAPTVLGYHFRLTCPHCQGVAMTSAGLMMAENALGFLPEERSQPGICTKCLRIDEYRNFFKEPVQTADRVLCSKFLCANRWDVIAFRYPSNPELRYIDRLVGLPGETIEIKDKAIWIDGVQANPPADIRDLQHLPHPGLDPANAQKEWTLGSDEYFVLGDFSTNSSDSRDWGPVPGANIESVVTLIYWPPARWRILR